MFKRRGDRDPQKALPVILMAVFIDLISNGILIPVVPQLLANPDSPYYMLPASIPVGYAYILLGVLISVVPILLFFSTPLIGEISDRIGRRKVMTYAISGTALAFTLFALGVHMKSLLLLFGARIVSGFVGGNISVAQAAIADITPPEKRSSRFGLIAAAYGVGFIIGPVIGGILSDPSIVPWFGASTPFWFAAILSTINAVLVFIYMSDTRKTEPFRGLNWRKAFTNIIHAYKMESLRPIFVTNFLFQSGIALFATFFTVFLINTFNFNQVDVGLYIGYAGIWLIISQGLILRFLSKKYDEIGLLRFFLFAGSLSMFAYFIPEQLIGLLIVGAFFAVTNGVSMASLPSLASRRAPEDRQGEILGINASVQALAQATPPIIAGLLAAKIAPSSPVFVAGIVIGVAWLIFALTVRRNTKEKLEQMELQS